MNYLLYKFNCLFLLLMTFCLFIDIYMKNKTDIGDFSTLLSFLLF